MTAQWKSNEPEIPTGACSGTYGSQQNVNLSINGTKDFSYTGSVTCAYLQKAGYYKLEVWGAQGGGQSTYYGGYGGYALGTIYSDTNSSIYIVVGQNVNAQSPAAYNGGGKGYGTGTDVSQGFSGGGATHISVQNCGELKNCESYKGTYNSSKGTYDGGKILIVAGGGGGTDSAGCGGHGGGHQGGNGLNNGCTAASTTGRGGTQTSGGTSSKGNGSFGQGAATTSPRAGGGGGWYGGSAGDDGQDKNGGGGGSGYIGNSLLLSAKGTTKQMSMYSIGCTSSTATTTKTTCVSNAGAHTANYVNTGNGYARITYLGT